MHAIQHVADSISLNVAYVLHTVLLLQAIEDKTFGLKNKSKSAKVQGCVHMSEALILPAAAAAAVTLYIKSESVVGMYNSCRSLPRSINRTNKTRTRRYSPSSLLVSALQGSLPLLPCQTQQVTLHQSDLLFMH